MFVQSSTVTEKSTLFSVTFFSFVNSEYILISIYTQTSNSTNFGTAVFQLSERQSSKLNVYHIGLGTMEISNYAYTAEVLLKLHANISDI